MKGGVKMDIKAFLGIGEGWSFNRVVLYLMIIYYIICVIYMIISLFRPLRRRHFLTFIFMCALPLVGIIITFFSKLRLKNTKRDIDFYNKYEAVDDGIIVPSGHDLNATSVKDVLLFNDVMTRRETVLDIFRGDAAQYVKEFKMALNDPDTEVSHYASSALTEIKRKYDNTVILLRKSVEDDPTNLQLKIQYASVLTAYIECKIMDRSNEVRYQNVYCGLVDEFWEQGREERDGVSMNLYKYWILYLQQIGQHDKAYFMSQQLLDRFNNEEIYFSVLEFYYNYDYKKEFFDTVERLRRSTIRLSKENLTTLRFFLRSDTTISEEDYSELLAEDYTPDYIDDLEDGGNDDDSSHDEDNDDNSRLLPPGFYDNLDDDLSGGYYGGEVNYGG